MKEFFKGWRRKVGLLTLVMACVAAVGWIRSVGRKEVIEFAPTNLRFSAASMSRKFLLTTSVYQSHLDALKSSDILYGNYMTHSGFYRLNLGWFSSPYPDQKGSLVHFKPSPDYEWRLERGEFGLGIAYFANRPAGIQRTISYVTAPHCVIVVPLTVLSAFLLLLKPRKSNQKKITEPIPEKVA